MKRSKSQNQGVTVESFCLADNILFILNKAHFYAIIQPTVQERDIVFLAWLLNQCGRLQSVFKTSNTVFLLSQFSFNILNKGDFAVVYPWEDSHFFLVFQCVAFPDMFPQAPTHILVVPKKPVAQLSQAEDDDKAVSVI